MDPDWSSFATTGTNSDTVTQGTSGADDDWGDFGGFQSAVDGSLTEETSPALSWAAAFGETLPQSQFTSDVSTEPIVKAEDTQTGTFPVQETSSTASAPAMSPVITQIDPSSDERVTQESVESDHTNAIVDKMSLEFQKLKTEKETLESKLAHTLLQLDEQKKHNQEMQTKMQQEMEKMEESSRLSLSILLEEYKRQTSEAVLENQQRCLIEAKAALDAHSEESRKNLAAQKDKYEKELEEERSKLQQQTTDMLSALRTEYQEQHETGLKEAMKTWQMKTAESLEEIKLESEEKLKSALTEEQTRFEKHQIEAEEKFKECLEEEKRLFELQIKEALEKQRDEIWESVQALIDDQKSKWQSLSEDVAAETRDQTLKYFNEKQKVDALSRRRQLTGMEILIQGVQNHLKDLILEEKECNESGEKAI